MKVDNKDGNTAISEVLKPENKFADSSHIYHLWVAADCVEEINAQQVFGYALYKDGKSIKLSYPLESFDSDVAGRSFHNGHFVQRMSEKAAALPK